MNKAGLILVVSLLLGGCGPTHVVVAGDYPKPLTPVIPVDGGLHFDAAFYHYSYSGEAGFDGKVDLGASQVALFNQVFAAMFRSAVEVNSIDQGSAGNLQLVISPQVEDVQLALPHDTQLEIYEMWIKYNIRVFDQRGELVADWVMTSYGKTLDTFLGSKKSAINQAAVAALRDAGAQLVTKFNRAPGVREWLQEQVAESANGEAP